MQRGESFSQRVRKYREREGITQDELAKRLGMSRNYVSMIEGGREPSDQVVRHFELLELAPPTPEAHAPPEKEGKKGAEPAPPKAEEQPTDYRLLKKAIRLQEEGTPDQIATVS